MLTIYLAWSLAHCCPLVDRLRSQGLDDASIEQMARSHGAPEWLIRYAKARCKRT